MAAKKRLDVLLVEQGYFDSREQAQRYIMSGEVWVDDLRVDKPGTKISPESAIRLTGTPPPYVSRGGFKLEGAFKAFDLNMQDAVVCDIGASTGGFVDCALQRGAKRVYAVDVGYGQLAWSLRQNPKVISMERTNARYLTPDDFPEEMDWVTTDVSFISLTKILPVAWQLLKPQGQVLALIKPQFEAGRDQVGKHGVVRDPVVHKEVLNRIRDFAEALGFSSLGVTASPIQGPQGNIEYLYWMSKEKPDFESRVDFEQLVEETFSHFRKKSS